MFQQDAKHNDWVQNTWQSVWFLKANAAKMDKPPSILGKGDMSINI